jgi:hypothetical protein
MCHIGAAAIEPKIRRFPFSTTNVASSARPPPPTSVTASTALAGTING